jgi:hypothetical protein
MPTFHAPVPPGRGAPPPPPACPGRSRSAAVFARGGRAAQPRPARGAARRGDGRRRGRVEPAPCSPGRRRPRRFGESTNSDLAFIGNYAIQGNYNGWQIWDISNPTSPTLKTAYFCPASQSDVSVYRNLLFVSGEGLTGRLDCGAQGVQDTVSHERLRGLRIFDITDIEHPRNVGNVQTCRGSHTHTVLVDPKDAENVYVYISGSAGVRSPNELPGCVRTAPDQDPNSSLFRIEVIKVPVAHPERAAIVSSPRIFNDLPRRRSTARRRGRGPGPPARPPPRAPGARSR